MQPLSGFRDFLPDDFARRDYITTQWRTLARRYGFVEFDGPTLESAELYQKKNSGGEILTQLYQFTDRGERPVALRPEMTPTLARIIGTHHRTFSKPLRWFNIGNCFRYERQQRGRLREFLQLNCDLLGESSPAADAEVITLLVDLLKSFGFGPEDFVIRLSDRVVWQHFLEQHGISQEKTTEFLSIIDKMEREPQEKTEEKLAVCSPALSLKIVQKFMSQSEVPALAPLLEELSARGVREYARPDLSIVRGLAYYTGVVFEAFALHGGLRAVAGGGRYDNLIHHLSDGAVNLPAVGFGMGDAVLLEFLRSAPAAAQKEEEYLSAHKPCQLYLVIADETYRKEAIVLASELRAAGWRVLFSLSPERVGKQFSAAEYAGASLAIVIGAEWPLLKVKRLSTREESEVSREDLFNILKELLLK
ncbi:MAG: histidine--tRNA ligase [Chthoniobacterales bacterium]